MGTKQRNLAVCTIVLIACALLVPNTQAYPTYQSANGAADNCSSCHAGFDAGFAGPLHGLHLTAVTECTACHAIPGSVPVQTKYEPGTPGCSGCHVLDGLVTHHANAGAPPDGMGLVCLSCHPGVSPGPESDIPPYYPGGSAALASVTLDPCDGSEELGASLTTSLDNDGDLAYDMADSDCAPAVEDCFNDADDDGDELIDCADPDCDDATDGACDTGQAGICAAGTRMCTAGFEVCDPDNAPQAEGPPGNASCEDGLDNDCDGAADSGDPDCQAPPEDCFDGVDNDLDDLIDCADPDCDGAAGDATSCGVGACADNTGQIECRGGAEVDTCDPLGGAAADDATCDGIDDDCDDLTDEDYASSATACGVGECAAQGLLECVGGQELDSCQAGEPATEGPFGDASCEDGLDNDCDGAMDAADPDCQATVETSCFDGVDNDLDDLIDCADPDCDGAAGGATSCGVGACADNTGQIECRGGAEVDTCDPLGGAAADDATCDGIDDDCDDLTDEDYASSATACGVGECAAQGLLECVGGQELDSCQAGEPATEGPFGDASCEDGLDNDCDGAMDAADPDCQATVETSCFDGVDNDLDDLIDCADPDCDGAAGGATSCGVGACDGNTGRIECRGGAEVDTCDPLGGAAADDATCDGVDDDCDDLTDEDYASSATACGVGECAAQGLLECVGGQELDSCQAGEPATEGPFGDASCEDGLDNDCDGAMDAADPDCQATVETSCFDGVDNDLDDLIDCADPDCDGAASDATSCGVGACADNTGQIECRGGAEVDTCDPLGGAAADDATCDGIDDDCDDLTDEDYASSATACGVGECAAQGLLECVGGQELDSCQAGEPATEGPFGDASCEDGLDNDCDGAMDAADPDCQATVETSCFDGVDNDLDDLIDCADPDCDGAAGGATSCGVGACADNTGQIECRGGAEVDTCDPLGGAAADDATCDGIDDDCDDLTDEDYASSATACGVGECAAQGLLECVGGQELDSCMAGEPATEGPFGDASCEDGLDNDCDGLADLDDADCEAAPETECFDGVDNDGDGVTDCADPDCEGAASGACDTGEPGVCAAGTYLCSNGELICRSDVEPQPEGSMYDNCNDGLDNDCDGFADIDDTSCDMMLADVWLVKLITHDTVNLKVGTSKPRRVFAMARADTKAQEATVTLTVDAPDGVTVILDPDTITQVIAPFVEGYDDDGSSDDGSSDDGSSDDGSSGAWGHGPLFKFYPVITCDEPGAYTITYTAEISAPENRTPEGDVATATSVVQCKPSRGRGSRHGWPKDGRRPSR